MTAADTLAQLHQHDRGRVAQPSQQACFLKWSRTVIGFVEDQRTAVAMHTHHRRQPAQTSSDLLGAEPVYDRHAQHPFHSIPGGVGPVEEILRA